MLSIILPRQGEKVLQMNKFEKKLELLCMPMLKLFDVPRNIKARPNLGSARL